MSSKTLNRGSLRLVDGETVRDRQWEGRFLIEALKSCQERYGLGVPQFVWDVKERVEEGQRRYGDRFTAYDAPSEVREEGQDAGIYAMLDAQVREEGQDILYEIAVHACAIDALTRKLELRDRGAA